MVAGALDDGLCLLEFSDPQRLEGQLAALKRLFGCPVLPGESPHLEQLRQQLVQYFTDQRRVFSLPLVYPGSDFQRQVWDALQQIPYGETRSYEQIAQQIGRHDGPGTHGRKQRQRKRKRARRKTSDQQFRVAQIDTPPALAAAHSRSNKNEGDMHTQIES